MYMRCRFDTAARYGSGVRYVGGAGYMGYDGCARYVGRAGYVGMRFRWATNVGFAATKGVLPSIWTHTGMALLRGLWTPWNTLAIATRSRQWNGAGYLGQIGPNEEG